MIETSMSLSACYRSSFVKHKCDFIEASFEQARSMILSGKVEPERLIVQLSAKSYSRFANIMSQPFIRAMSEELEWLASQGVELFVFTHLSYKSKSVNNISVSAFADVMSQVCDNVELSDDACVYVEAFPESRKLNSFMSVARACEKICALKSNDFIDVAPAADLQRDVATSTDAMINRIFLKTDFVRVSRDSTRKAFMPNRMPRELSTLEAIIEKSNTDAFYNSLLLAYDENNLRTPSNTGVNRFINWCSAAQLSTLEKNRSSVL